MDIVPGSTSTRGMAIIPPRNVYFISDINTNSGMWTVVVQVVESHRTQDSQSKRGNQAKIYKRLLLVDEHGTKVSGVLYDNDIQYYSTSLKPFKRYRISNAKLTPAFSHFKVGPYQYSWIINNETPVEPVDEPNVPPLPFSYTTCPFNEFIRHADKDFAFHVKGIAIHAFPQRQVTSHSSIREIVIIDESKKPIMLGLWNSFGDIEGRVIADNIANTPVIIGVNVRATTFNGLSLSTRPFSCILTDPPLSDNPSLKEWYARNKTDITEMLRNKAYKQLDLLLPPPTMNETIDVPTALAAINMQQFSTAWVVGEIRFAATKQAYHFCVCENCNKKVTAPPGWHLHCSNCDQYAEIQLRCRVPLELIEGNESLQVVMSSPNVEDLTGITAQQLRDSHEFDLDVYQELQMSLDKLRVVCFIKKYDPTTLGSLTNPRLRYAVVKAYTLDAIQQPSALSHLETPQPLLPSTEDPSIAAKDVQFFTPNTKKILTEVEGISAPEKHIQPGPSAKRGIVFMSTESPTTKLTDPGFPANKSEDTKVAPTKDETIHESPVKKGRDKLKLN